MKLEYNKVIHKEKGKKDEIRFNVIHPKDVNVIQPCCKESELVMGLGFFEIAYDNREKYDRDWEQRQLPTERPEICLHTMECSDCDGGEERLYPIPKCPFCGKDNDIILKQIKEVTHVKVKKTEPARTYETTEAKEKILFNSEDEK